MAIEHPNADVPEHERLVVVAKLRDESFSVSAGWGKAFEKDGVSYGHVLDPRSGRPAQNSLLAAVSLLGGTASDAWSTALLVSGESGTSALGQAVGCARSLLLLPDDETGFRLANNGFESALS
jgi:thiamine biosynthesis lipoprotein